MAEVVHGTAVAAVRGIAEAVVVHETAVVVRRVWWGAEHREVLWSRTVESPSSPMKSHLGLWAPRADFLVLGPEAAPRAACSTILAQTQA